MILWVPGSTGMLGKYLNRFHQRVDITDLSAIETFIRYEGITHIINCAAYTHVDKAETERKKAELVNVIGPQNLGIVSKKFGIPIVHISTDYVFDGKSKLPYKETDPVDPLNIYGLTKFQGEQALLNETNHACIIRTSWLYGLYGKNFVQTMIQLMQERDELSVVSDQIGRPTYAYDLAQIALKMFDHYGIYHFSNSGETSWFDFAKDILEIGSSFNIPFTVKEIKPIQTKDYPTPAKRPHYSCLNTEKIEKELNFKARPWKDTLIDYYGHLQC